MQRVASLDSVFWNFDTPTTHQAIASLCLLDGYINFSTLRERVSALPERFPKLRQFIDSRAGLHWVEDEKFSLEYHLQLRRCPHVSTEQELLAEVQQVFSERLDMQRPLWRFTVFLNCSEQEQRSGATLLRPVQAAILFTIHHSLADGLGGLELVDAVFDQTRQRLRGRRADDSVRMDDKEKPRGIWFDAGRSVSRWIEELFAAKARGKLNGANSSERRLAVRSFDLSLLRRAKARAGVSFNDLVLTLVAGAVRRYQLEVGERCHDVRALIPVNLRVLNERNTLGNRITGVGVSLPSSLVMPLARLEMVRKTLRDLKESGALGAYALLGEFVAKLPGWLQRICCESQARRTNFICTNMPGKNELRTVCGVTVRANYAFAALMRGHGIAFGFISYAGNLCAAVVGDARIVPEPERLLALFEEEVTLLVSEISQQLAA